MNRSMARVGTVFLFLTIALATMAVGYGLWSKILTVNGTVNTGTVNAQYSNDQGEVPFTDDDGVVDNPAKDALDDNGSTTPEVFDGNGAASSADPSAPGPNPTRYDKDVGACVVVKWNNDMQLNITADTTYPSYWCTTWYHVKNTGTIPLKLQAIALIDVNASGTADQLIVPSEYWCIDTDDITDAVEVAGSATPCPGISPPGAEAADQSPNEYDIKVHVSELSIGLQIDPGDPNPQGNVDLHVEQGAAQSDTLDFFMEMLWVQWNEFAP